MAQLFNITHDADNLDEYDSTVTDGGDLSTGTPGLANTTAKMQAFIDSTDGIFGQKNILSPAIVRARLYVDPNTLTMANGDQFLFHRFGQRAGGFSPVVDLFLRFETGTGFSLIAKVINDDGGQELFDVVTVSDEPHYVEYHVVRASSDIADNATFEWWIDGVSQETLIDIDIYNIMFDENMRFILGASSSLDAGTGPGTLYLDELRANDDGKRIGPVGLGARIDHHYRMRRAL